AALVKDRAMHPITSLEQVASSLLLDGAFDNIHCRPYDDGETYLAPVFFEVEGLIYNKSLMTGNGWTVPSTWAEFVALGDLAKAKKISLFTYAGRDTGTLTGMFASGIASFAGTEEAEKLFRYAEGAWDSAAVRTFLSEIDKLSYLVASGSSTKTEKEALDTFLAGNVLFISGDSELLAKLSGEKREEEEGSGSAAESETVVAEPTFELGFIGYPTFGAGDKKVSAITFTEMYIPIEAKQVDLAEKFLIFQYSDAAASLCAEKLDEVTPVRKAADLAAASGVTGSRLQAYATLGERVCAGDFAIKSGENETLSDEFAALLVSVFKGETDADTFINKMNESAKEMQ
ncbi:MAG TPA: extracellular solute-binding protein, partial [Oscillospiraceae bacterium]|nr:extracellular solute-binding protein [Oscillospiraceae bacterium]